jgi:TrmH family RNA methyltransferase
MISKNRIKQIVSLRMKKARDKQGIYLIEGNKLVKEYLMSGIRMRLLAAREEFIASLSADERASIDEIESVSYDDLKRISTLKTPHNAVAMVPFPGRVTEIAEIIKDLCIALDFVQDPGNLGTIIRSAAWFGIKNIICSNNCVDLYNPKVIQASMGAILNVNVHYLDLGQFLNQAFLNNIPVFGAFLEGESIYNHNLDKKGVILLGNESRGISGELIPFVTSRIMIPKFSNPDNGIESLNVSMAAAIILSEFARRRR